MGRHTGKCGYCLAFLLLIATSSCMKGSGGGGGTNHGGGGNGGGNGGGGNAVPPPTLTSLSPGSVTAGGPVFKLTINGSGFVNGGTISWNSNSIGSYTFVSSSQVTILISAPMIATTGSAAIAANIPGSNGPSNTLNLPIQPFSSSACAMFGMYSFLFTGFENPGVATIPFTVAGTFGVDANGNVSGEEDFKDLTTTRVADAITGGNCTNGATANEGALTITTAAGTSNYTFVTQSLPSPGVKGRIVEAEANGTTGSGRFVSIVPGEFLSGDFVLALIGNDSSGKRMGVVGRFTDNNNNQLNTTGTLANGLGDINDYGALTTSATITGTVTPPDVYSRCTATVTIGAQPLTLALYVVATTGGFALNVDSGTSTPLLTGFLSFQQAYGLLNNGNLNAPVILNTWGVFPEPPLSSDTSIGLGSTFNAGLGTFNLQLDSVTASVPNLNQNLAATYSVDKTGRGTMTFTPVGAGLPTTYTVYLDAFNDGYMLDTSVDVRWGFFQAQTGTSLNIGTFLGGTFFSPVSNSPNTVGSISLDGSTISGALTGGYTINGSRGTATVTQPSFGGLDLVFYIFGSDGFVTMGIDGVANDAISFFHM